MNYFGVERRRASRFEPAKEQKLSLDVSIPVQVLDISLAGILLASKAELSVGDRAELKATIGTRSISVVIEIRQVSMEANPTRGVHRHRAGAVFAAMSAEQQLLLEQLLGTEPL